MRAFVVLTLVLLATVSARSAEANPLDRWRVSCGADAGSISGSGGNWTFRTSSNHCDGGIFKQRAEIASDKIAPSHRGTYRFSTTLSLASPSSETLTLFQIHDGRLGCGPPLMVRLGADNRLFVTGDYKIGTQPGENCVRDVLSSTGKSSARLPRDGSAHDFAVILDFDGQSGFRVFFYLDGALQLSGQYRVSDDPRLFRSQHFYFKHGVYSQDVVPYEMSSRGLRVDKVQLAQ
ncbi:hypothetical protein [Maritimibacter sp. DP1N21-5]|uniref:hypothetical protein n=1 Tax=Maritimibacter sp. DP1N21-5 TaxID=2836867 RepID=UPI001C48BE72|nr:hypothetical protein [Maritimibacter sp. DP1N21-5]MBV7410442.1 hypothetical protein [Maritimibacter sp. DP1N21-5]